MNSVDVNTYTNTKNTQVVKKSGDFEIQVKARYLNVTIKSSFLDTNNY